MKTTLLDKILTSLRKRGWKLTDQYLPGSANVGPAEMTYYQLGLNDDGTVHITNSGSQDFDVDCGNHRTVSSAIQAMGILIGPRQDPRLRNEPALVKNVDYIDRFGDES